MTVLSSKYSDQVQKVSKDTPIEDILYLLKRDGGVFVRGLIPEDKIDQAISDVKDRLDSDVEWNGCFFPGGSSTCRDAIEARGVLIRIHSANPAGSISDSSQPNIH